MFIIRPTQWDMKVLHGNKMLKTLIQLYGTSYRTDSRFSYINGIEMVRLKYSMRLYWFSSFIQQH